MHVLLSNETVGQLLPMVEIELLVPEGGCYLLDGLVADGVDTAHVARVNEPTGTAFLIVSPDDVSNIIVRGARRREGSNSR